MKRRATGIAIHAIITSPSETIAPARVPGTDTFPNALSVAGLRLSVFGWVSIILFFLSPKNLALRGREEHLRQTPPRLANRFSPASADLKVRLAKLLRRRPQMA
jgi:hypothetical protein